MKGFNPIDPSKTVRTDSLEITTDSKAGAAQPSQYVIKTSIQARTDAQASNTELGKVLGEPCDAVLMAPLQRIQLRGSARGSAQY